MKKGEFNLFKCETCNDDVELESDAFTEHLLTVHGIPKGTPMKRSMMMHADARDFYEYHYLWESGDVKFHQLIRLKRDKDDLMRHA